MDSLATNPSIHCYKTFTVRIYGQRLNSTYGQNLCPRKSTPRYPDEKRKVYVDMMVVFVAVALKVAVMLAMVIKRNSYFSYLPFSAQF